MSRLRAITARFGAGRKRDPEEPRVQADGAAAASATDDEQYRPGAGPEIDNPAATSNAASLAEFEADGTAPREGDQPAAPRRCARPRRSSRPPEGALIPVDRVVRSVDRPAGCGYWPGASRGRGCRAPR
jgi:hypothetical protein